MNQASRDPQRQNRQRLDRQLGIAADPSRNRAARCRAARLAAALAEKLGLIERPRKCEWCQRHRELTRRHADYSQPLAIQWLCPGCHHVAVTEAAG